MNEYQENEDYESSDNDSVNTLVLIQMQKILMFLKLQEKYIRELIY